MKVEISALFAPNQTLNCNKLRYKSEISIEEMLKESYNDFFDRINTLLGEQYKINRKADKSELSIVEIEESSRELFAILKEGDSISIENLGKETIVTLQSDGFLICEKPDNQTSIKIFVNNYSTA